MVTIWRRGLDADPTWTLHSPERQSHGPPNRFGRRPSIRAGASDWPSPVPVWPSRRISTFCTHPSIGR